MHTGVFVVNNEQSKRLGNWCEVFRWRLLVQFLEQAEQ